ncbi:MAG: NAD(P)H-dependent glycerol-3-phosphate dehydrogenase [Cellvibrionaceae bacterium]
MTDNIKVAVLGGGSFGTAIANVIASNGFPTSLWMRDSTRAEQAQSLRENQNYLPGYKLADALTVTSELAAVIADADIIFVSVPSAVFRDVVKLAKPHLADNAMVVSTTKGISRDGFTLMSQILAEELTPAIPGVSIGVLSGPNFAKEMIQGQITGSVIASTSNNLVARVQELIGSSQFRIYSSEDCYGVELAGALKNIYAIIAGMTQARQYGSNTMALLMTRALAEMGRFAHALGADPMTFLGLAGVGDLILTCNSTLSRNYRVGYAMGEGKSLTRALKEVRQVVEGVNTLRLVKEKAEELNVHMPLASALYALLFEGETADNIINQLMLSEQNSDVDFTGAIRDE